MKIKDENNPGFIKRTNHLVHSRKRAIKRTLLFFLLAVMVAAWFVSSRIIKTKGYSGVWDFVKTVSSNYWDGRKATPENISIEIKDKDLNVLKKNRQQALERGVIINDLDGDYVSATLTYKDKTMKVKLRLKGHMTDHLQDDKWSFRIKVKGNDSFMGMKRFSIQHPGTRGYIYEWIYHELMRKEDIIALRYKFINVSVNGKDWGIYAVEENFDNELIENNSRKNGPIIRFNPDLYWVDRYNELKGVQPVAEFASYYSAPVEAYREDQVLADSTQKQYYLKAIALMEGFRSRKLPLADVFDVERLAKFHAIIDLVGGEHSIDWSDIKYYYNPVKAKLEPVAYESFTVFPFQEIAGLYRFRQLDSNQLYPDLHTALFSDPRFFEAYVKALKRVSAPAYLDAFFDGSNEELKNNLRILNKEFPYKKFEKKDYYANQQMIRQLLAAPKSIHAYLKSSSGNRLQLQIGSIESLPVEIHSITFGKQTILPEAPVLLPAKQHNEFVNYKDLSFALPAGITWNDSLAGNLKINYSIPGGDECTASVFPFPHTDAEFIAADLKNKKGNIAEFPFLAVNGSGGSIVMKPGKNVIDKDLVIPAGYRLMAGPGAQIDIKNNAKIISYSPLVLIGSEDDNIIVSSSDSSSQGIEIINALPSVFENVMFKGLPKVKDQQWARTGSITCYESAVTFKGCSFYNCKAEDAINLIRSAFTFKECLFHNMHDDAVDIDFSEGTIEHCAFENCNENALDLTMGKVKLTAVYINVSGNKGINVKAGSQLRGSDVRIKNSRIALSAEDLSGVDLQKVEISDSETGIVAYKNKPGGGHPVVKISGLVLKNVKTNYLKEKKSVINANGVEVNESVENVEALIKSEKKKHP